MYKNESLFPLITPLLENFFIDQLDFLFFTERVHRAAGFRVNFNSIS